MKTRETRETKESRETRKNKKTLVIVESPAKCKKIEGFLGPGYHVVATLGHFRDIGGLENICMTSFDVIKYKILANDYKEKNIDRIKKLMDTNAYDEIIMATDDDREGEAIAWHVCDMFGLSIQNTQRIVFHEITEPAIKTALANPRRIDMHLVEAQKGRQVLDMLVGFRVSPILWRYIACNEEKRKELSAGRCQTPALKIIYENEQEVAKHPGKHVYHVSGIFTNQNVVFNLNHEFSGKEEVRQFLELSKTFAHVYSCGEPRRTTKRAPEPLTTSRIQQIASNELHLSPKDTMKICQRLYEAGLITYMRTDSKKYSGVFLESVVKWMERNGLERGVYVRDLSELSMDRGAEGAHEAIRPTHVEKRELLDRDTEEGSGVGSFTQKERRLYALIWKTAMQSCMTDAVYNQIVCTLTAPQETQYTYISETVEFLGWKKLDHDPLQSKNVYSYLSTLKNGSIIPYKQISTEFTIVDRKPHYTEAKWVNLLEEKGIGRPSTYSSLIEKVQERGYVVKQDIAGVMVDCVDFVLALGSGTGSASIVEINKKKELGAEKGKVVIQPLGIVVIEFLIKHFPSFFEYSYTKYMEDALDSIAHGLTTKQGLCYQCNHDLSSLMEAVKVAHTDIQIDADHVYKVGKFGPYIETRDKKCLSLRKGITIHMEKLRSGGYSVGELVEVNSPKKFDETYQGKSLVIKKGRYGLYAEWGDQRVSLAALGNRPIENVGVEEVIGILDSKCISTTTTTSSEKEPGVGEKPESKIVRTIDENTSIRKGPYGDYIFYKTKKMTKPRFLKLDGYNGDYKTGNIELLKRWIHRETHG